MNRLRQDEASDMQGCLTEMRAKGLTSYRHAGVELARVPGEEKLRVRTSKEKATAEVEEPEGDDNPIAGGEFGEDRQDALEAEG